MKRNRLLRLLAAFAVTAALAATVVWEGVTWNNSYGTIAVSGGSLLVDSTSVFTTSRWGAAHYNTPSSFRSALTPCLEVTFVDSDADTGTQLWIEDENYPVGGAWTQFGFWSGDANYRIYWWDYDTGLDGVIDTGIARTPGEHTLKVGKRVDGTVDYWVDGAFVTSAPITPGYFGDVYLASHGKPAGPVTTAEYTAYQTCTDYVLDASAEIAVNPKSINLRSKGKTKVTILSEGAFDATSVDPASVLFAGAAVAGNNKGKLMSSTADADGDGDVDLILHFNTQDLDLAVGDTAAELTGTAVDLSGNPYPFHATGAVNINKG